MPQHYGPRTAAQIAEPIVRTMIVAEQAARVDADRLQYCGLAYHERQRDHFCWVGPPEKRIDGEPLVRVLPLTQAKPMPNLEIRAHGEIYLIPFDFAGTWFSVTSPTGRKLIQ